MTKTDHPQEQEDRSPLGYMSSAEGFLALLSSYPVLEVFATHITSEDLLCVAKTCRNAHNALRLDQESRRCNLLSKTLRCSGHGVYELQQIWLATPVIRPRALPPACNGPEIYSASRSCATCGIVTCNECRIYVLHQSKLPTGNKEEKDFSKCHGQIFLDNVTYRTVPNFIQAVAAKDLVDSTWYGPNPGTKFRHDYGRICVRRRYNGNHIISEPVNIFLNQELGHTLVLKGVFPGNLTGGIEWNDGRQELKAMLKTFQDVADARIILRCGSCLAQQQDPHRCECTLHKRFVDCWQCIPCFAKYDAPDSTANTNASKSACACGFAYTYDPHASIILPICKWCEGIVFDDQDFDKEERQTVYQTFIQGA